MKRIAGFIVLLISVAGLLISCGKRPERHYDGYIEGDNSYLASPYGGKLLVLLVHRGDRVKKGQKLFVLDEDPERLVLQQTKFDLLQAQKTYDDLVKPRRTQEIQAIEAQIKQAKADAELAAIRMKRYERLYKSKATDKDTYDAAAYLFQNKSQVVAQIEANLALASLGAREDQIQAQKAIVQSLQEKMMNAQWALVQKTGYAPADGIIIDTLFNQGEFVGNQTPVVSFLSPDNTHVQFYVPLKELNHLRLGDRFHFTALNDKNRVEAVISFIAEEAEFVPPVVYSRDNVDHLVFRIQARFKLSDRFKPGQPVSVYLP